MKAALAVCVVLLAASGCAGSAAGPPVSAAAEGPGALAEPSAGFLGNEACGACHPAAYDRWRATGHARAFAGLPDADRAAPACLRCHVTGYGEPLGYRAGGPADLASVGCESCHGAGADHARSAHPGLVPTATGGECPPCEVNRICRLCHTAAHSPEFDLARALERVACRRAGR